MRNWLVGLTALALVAVPVIADDLIVTNLNPSGVVMNPVVNRPPMDPEDLLCGSLAFDGVNGLAAERWVSLGLSAWDMSYCEFDVETTIQAFKWVTVDDSLQVSQGNGDYAIWTAALVETGCAGDVADVANGNFSTQQTDLNQTLFGRPVLEYYMPIGDVVLPPGGYYFGTRVVGENGQSFILTVPCDGNREGYFQSDFFGIPCAVTNTTMFGAPYCPGIAVLGKQGEPKPKCIYQVNKVKNMANLCGAVCADCPYVRGDLVCTNECPNGGADCRTRLKGFNACSNGAACKVIADLVGCEVPPGNCKRCR